MALRRVDSAPRRAEGRSMDNKEKILISAPTREETEWIPEKEELEEAA
jgi:hypothetical protein